MTFGQISVVAVWKTGLVLEAHRLLCHSTLRWRVIKKKKKTDGELGFVRRGGGHFDYGASRIRYFPLSDKFSGRATHGYLAHKKHPHPLGPS